MHEFVGTDDTLCHNKVGRVPGRNPLITHYVDPKHGSVPGQGMTCLIWQDHGVLPGGSR
jgi:hypothetical protein